MVVPAITRPFGSDQRVTAVVAIDAGGRVVASSVPSRYPPGRAAGSELSAPAASVIAGGHPNKGGSVPTSHGSVLWADLVPDLPEQLLAGRERDYVGWFLQQKSLSPDTFSKAEIDFYAREIARDGGLRASLAYYRDAASSAQKNHASLRRRRLSLPVLGVSSDHGSIPDMAASISPYANNVTGALIPGAGHFIPDEQPAALARALTDFICTARSTAASPQTCRA